MKKTNLSNKVMTKHLFLPIRILHLISIGLFLSSCTSVESRWQAARQRDDMSAYGMFVRQFPDSQYTPSARARIEQIAFEKAMNVGTLEALLAYRRHYRSGEHADAVLARIEQINRQRQQEMVNTLTHQRARLREYKPGQLTEKQLLQDGWNTADVHKGKLGILRVSRANGRAEYTIGASPVLAAAASTIPTDASDLWREMDSFFVNAVDKDESLSYEGPCLGGVEMEHYVGGALVEVRGAKSAPAPAIPICIMRFVNQQLAEIVWYDRQT